MVKIVDPYQAFGVLEARCQIADLKRRGIGRHDAIAGQMRFERRQERFLYREILKYGFDHEVTLTQRFHASRVHTSECRGRRVRTQDLFFAGFVEAATDSLEPTIHVSVGPVHEINRAVFHAEVLRNGGAHIAGANYPNRFKLTFFHAFLFSAWSRLS